jgi:predicted nucleic acid-binding protein
MISYVVDASVAIKWYIPEVYSNEAEILLDSAYILHAPELILPEFGNIIWKKVRRGEITAAQRRQIIKAFLQTPMQLHPGANILPSAYEIADRTAQTVYDCMYLTLAVALGCEMVTADKRFFQAICQTPLNKNILSIAAIS